MPGWFRFYGTRHCIVAERRPNNASPCITASGCSTDFSRPVARQATVIRQPQRSRRRTDDTEVLMGGSTPSMIIGTTIEQRKRGLSTKQNEISVLSTFPRSPLWQKMPPEATGSHTRRWPVLRYSGKSQKGVGRTLSAACCNLLQFRHTSRDTSRKSHFARFGVRFGPHRLTPARFCPMCRRFRRIRR